MMSLIISSNDAKGTDKERRWSKESTGHTHLQGERSRKNGRRMPFSRECRRQTRGLLRKDTEHWWRSQARCRSRRACGRCWDKTAPTRDCFDENETSAWSQDSGRHLDKTCGRVADTSLDEVRQACFGCKCRIACETRVKKDKMLEAIETTGAGQIDHEMAVPEVQKDTGLDLCVDELPWLASPGSLRVQLELASTSRVQTSPVVHTPTAKTSTRKLMTSVPCSSMHVIKREAQCPSHARQQGIELSGWCGVFASTSRLLPQGGGLPVDRDDLGIVTGDRDASDETENTMPLTLSMSTLLIDRNARMENFGDCAQTAQSGSRAVSIPCSPK